MWLLKKLKSSNNYFEKYFQYQLQEIVYALMNALRRLWIKRENHS